VTDPATRHPLTGELVVIAPGRAARPGARGRTERLDPARVCPFCEGNEHLTPPEVAARPGGRRPPDTPGWSVRTVPNKFPAIPGQEVVVHGPAHALTVTGVAGGIMDAVVETWLERAWFHLDRGADHVLIGINEGPAAGASLEHSHSQVVPFADVPPRTAALRAGFARGCPLCAGGTGHAVATAGGVVTTCPPWSRMPYEMLIAPAQHEAWPSSPADLATAVTDACARLQRLLGTGVAWNAVLHLPGSDAAGHHWHVELYPRLTVAASLELGAAVWVNVVDPPVAAAELAG
jgi:UDPglucose--hexose-1-phosphate uridylyltransferase